MIDEKKIINDIKQWSKEREIKWTTESVINLLESAPKIGGWIPCSERLPESFLKVVLVCLKNGAVSVAICGTDGEFINMMVGASRQKFRYFPEHNPVIAWQPLPEAYHG